jgi:oxygen-independent coproporphyrinogen-3 oxidase
MAFLYIHVPFCRHKCHYCAFNSDAAAEDLFEPYVAALKKELRQLAATSADRRLETLFIGGGTPTVLPSSLLGGIVRHCLELFAAVPGVEITVEANPGTVDEAYLAELQAAGVNRLSLGVQTFDDRELRDLGRIHDSRDAYAAVRAAKKAGFANINLDLMYGLPGQTRATWNSSLDAAISLAPEHLSLYQLTVEAGTPMERLVATKRLVLPGEDEIALMDETTGRLCRQAGFRHYEIANYARPGRACRHNINYWQNGEYLGCGVSAVSCRRGVREVRVADAGEYIRRLMADEPVVVDQECLAPDASFRETVIMGLRLVAGVSCRELKARYPFDLQHYYGKTLTRLLDLELVELAGDYLRLTDKGRPFANRVMAELV